MRRKRIGLTSREISSRPIKASSTRFAPASRMSTFAARIDNRPLVSSVSRRRRSSAMSTGPTHPGPRGSEALRSWTATPAGCSSSAPARIGRRTAPLAPPDVRGSQPAGVAPVAGDPHVHIDELAGPAQRPCCRATVRRRRPIRPSPTPGMLTRLDGVEDGPTGRPTDLRAHR
jgi:hypothetical protein